MTWVNDTAWGIIMHVFAQFTKQWGDLAWMWFSKLFAAPLAVIADPIVVTLTQISVAAALGFLPVVITWQALSESVARLDGAATTAPETLIRRSILTGIAVTGTSVVAWFIGTLADLGRELLGAVGLNIDFVETFFVAPHGAPGTVIMITLVFLTGGLVLTFQRVVIAAEFTVLMVIGPLMAIGLMRENGSSIWSIWLREVISLVITPVIQMLVLLLFIRKYAASPGALDIMDRLASLAFLWVLWNTPRWARQMVYQSGIGGAMVSGAAGVSRLVMMRQMMTKVVTKI